MVANLPPEYHLAAKKYKEAKTTEDKIAALEEMLSIMPKHKGTENLQADLRKKLSKLKEDQQKKGRKGFSFTIPKEGAGQLYILGPPNSGKSSLFYALTGIETQIADYPFTTTDYKAGLMPYENIKIQLVDTPPITAKFMDKWLVSLLKNSDGVLFVIDPSSADILEEFEGAISILETKAINLINKSNQQNILSTLFIANKIDKEKAKENLQAFIELVEYPIEFLEVSAKTKANLQILAQRIFRMLNIIRVYCKPSGKKPDMDNPVILKKNSTVLDFAYELRKDFAKNLRSAKLYNSQNLQGNFVSRNYILNDGDIIELIL